MSVIIALAALALLMLAAYRGYSVILFAPIAALGAVLLTDPSAVAPAFTGVFMEKMVGFIELYFPVFLLGAVFGKLDRAVGVLALHRGRCDPLARHAPGDAGDRAGLRPAHLRRRVAVRGGVRGVPVRGRDVPPEQYPQAPDPGDHRPRRILVHDGCPARHAADPEHHPQHLLQHHRLGGAVAGVDRHDLRVLHRHAVPGAATQQGPARG